MPTVKIRMSLLPASNEHHSHGWLPGQPEYAISVERDGVEQERVSPFTAQEAHEWAGAALTALRVAGVEATDEWPKP